MSQSDPLTRRIVLIQGHPDRNPAHFCHALAAAYAEGAETAGHEIRRLTVAELGLPPLLSREDWESEPASDTIRSCQETIGWAEHLVIVYPLWLGDLPALLKGFFEQVFRPGFAIPKTGSGTMLSRLLKGRSARVVVTMGMPALVYKWYFGAHSLKSLKRSLLGLAGIGPIRESLVGMVESGGEPRHQKWLRRMRALGERGA